MPNVMATLPNMGGALCSMPQKFGWRPLLECRAVTLLRRETRWSLQGCPKLANRSQPLVGRSSPYYEGIWRKYCCLISFSDCRYMPYLRRYSPTKLCDGAELAIFLRHVFSASRVQRISDMHSKFALRPHRVWKYGRHPISDRWEERSGMLRCCVQNLLLYLLT